MFVYPHCSLCVNVSLIVHVFVVFHFACIHVHVVVTHAECVRQFDWTTELVVDLNLFVLPSLVNHFDRFCDSNLALVVQQPCIIQLFQLTVDS